MSGCEFARSIRGDSWAAVSLGEYWEGMFELTLVPEVHSLACRFLSIPMQTLVQILWFLLEKLETTFLAWILFCIPDLTPNTHFPSQD